jgi:hypothetical protein
MHKTEVCVFIGIHTALLGALFLFFFILLFICAYKAWVISPPAPTPTLFLIEMRKKVFARSTTTSCVPVGAAQQGLDAHSSCNYPSGMVAFPEVYVYLLEFVWVGFFSCVLVGGGQTSK